MNKVITLEQYLKLGGNLLLLNMKYTYCTYYTGKSYNNKIINIKEDGYNKDKSSKLYKCDFEDNTTHKYAAMWIETTVQLILAPQFIQS